MSRICWVARDGFTSTAIAASALNQGEAKDNDGDTVPDLNLALRGYVRALNRSVSGAAGNSCAFGPHRRWRLEDVPRNCRTRGAGGNRCWPARATGPGQGYSPGKQGTALPNPSTRTSPQVNMIFWVFGYFPLNSRLFGCSGLVVTLNP